MRYFLYGKEKNAAQTIDDVEKAAESIEGVAVSYRGGSDTRPTLVVDVSDEAALERLKSGIPDGWAVEADIQSFPALRPL